jgi:hypothetical protein
MSRPEDGVYAISGVLQTLDPIGLSIMEFRMTTSMLLYFGKLQMDTASNGGRVVSVNF